MVELYEGLTVEDLNGNSPTLALALKHQREILSEGKRWAELEITRDYVRLRIGMIMTDGRRECCVGIRHYTMNGEGEPTYYYSLQV